MEFEVPVTHSHITDGLVDCVWLAEGYNNHRKTSYCSASERLSVVKRIDHRWDANVCRMSPQQLKSVEKNSFIECMIPCVYKKFCNKKDETVAIICYEIKISKADFHSRNGHNFIGNLNFYVMPYGLYKEVKDEIPDSIGVITYHYTDENTVGSLRLKKHCEYKSEVNQELCNSLLHTFLDRKEKKLQHLTRKASTDRNAMLQDVSCVIQKLMIKMRDYIQEPDCYKQNYGNSCSNSTPIQIRCNTCPYGSIYKQSLLKLVEKDDKEVTHY